MSAEHIGVGHGIPCCDTTVALELAAASFRIDERNEVIMPAHTIIGCAQAVMRRGGTPVLVDMDPESWQMDVAQVVRKDQ